jgi:hypothetical protein
MLGKDGTFVKSNLQSNLQTPMNPLVKNIFLGLLGCIALSVGLGYGLSLAVNYSLAQFTQEVDEFLPSGAEEPQSP